MSGQDGMPIVTYGDDPQGTWKRGLISAAECHRAMAEHRRALSPQTRPLWSRIARLLFKV